MASDTNHEELLEARTATGESLGPLPRSTVHTDGHWHDVFHCLIVRSTAPARVVLQRRAADKSTFPGLLDLSVTGHLAAGESPADGVREIAEELGVEVDPSDLIPLGVRLLADDAGEGGRNRERVHVHLLVDDRPLSDFAPDPVEVDATVEIEVDHLLRLTTGGPDPVTARRCRVDEAGPGAVETVQLRSTDLVHGTDGYWVVLAVMAGRLVAGDTPLAV